LILLLRFQHKCSATLQPSSPLPFFALALKLGVGKRGTEKTGKKLCLVFKIKNIRNTMETGRLLWEMSHNWIFMLE